MAHFAEINPSNIVVDVVVVNNEDCIDPNTGQESEAVGIAYLNGVLPDRGPWVQTSYNGNFRGCYAGIGYTWDAANNVFVPPVEEP